MELLKRIGHAIGLTRESRIELSDLVEEDATVTSKEFVEEQEDDYLIMARAVPVFVPDYEPAQYLITLKGGRASFDFDDEGLYAQFEEGNSVRLTYRQMTRVFFDYVEPDFTEKVEVGRESAGYEFEGAEKIE